MPLIDVHNHIFSREYADLLARFGGHRYFLARDAEGRTVVGARASGRSQDSADRIRRPLWGRPEERRAPRRRASTLLGKGKPASRSPGQVRPAAHPVVSPVALRLYPRPE